MKVFISCMCLLVGMASAQPDIHTKFGIPRGNIIIERNEFVYSVNPKTGFSDWVLYQVDKNDFGDAPRWERAFFRDSLVNLKLNLPKNSDYENSGYDRGHLVRSEERTINQEANRNTFVLTNIVPQTEDLNRGPWLDLERWVENVCKDSTYQMWIVSGPIFDKQFSKLNKKYLIPKFYFKVILIQKPNGSFTKFGVVMPNIQGIRHVKWEKFITPINEIEKASKLKFFDKIK